MRSTACRWETTACRRSSPGGSRASAKLPRLRDAHGKALTPAGGGGRRPRSVCAGRGRRGEVDEASAPAAPTDGAVGDGVVSEDGQAAPPAKGGAPQGDIRLRQAM